jgi:hypothetical protein
MPGSPVNISTSSVVTIASDNATRTPRRKSGMVAGIAIFQSISTRDIRNEWPTSNNRLWMLATPVIVLRRMGHDAVIAITAIFMEDEYPAIKTAIGMMTGGGKARKYSSNMPNH